MRFMLEKNNTIVYPEFGYTINLCIHSIWIWLKFGIAIHVFL